VVGRRVEVGAAVSSGRLHSSRFAAPRRRRLPKVRCGSRPSYWTSLIWSPCPYVALLGRSERRPRRALHRARAARWSGGAWSPTPLHPRPAISTGSRWRTELEAPRHRW